MVEAWELYFDEFQRLARHVPAQQFGRGDAFAVAAHAAYRHTADRLTAEGWDDERTLHLVRGLNEAARVWIERDGISWDGLRRRLSEIAASAGPARS
jgi:hypothetical protein